MIARFDSDAPAADVPEISDGRHGRVPVRPAGELPDNFVYRNHLMHLAARRKLAEQDDALRRWLALANAMAEGERPDRVRALAKECVERTEFVLG